jgi:hypothetical protein
MHKCIMYKTLNKTNKWKLDYLFIYLFILGYVYYNLMFKLNL